MAKMRYDSHLFQDESVKVYHILSKLRDTAAIKLDPWRQTETTSPGYFTVLMLFQELDKHFKDFEAKETALRQITKIKQNNSRLSDFLSEFDRLLLLADGYHWDEAVKITYLENAIAMKLRDRLVGRVRDTTLHAFQTTLRRIDLDLSNLRVGATIPPPAVAPVNMAWEQTPAPPPVSTSAAAVQPKDSRKRATFLSEEEFRKRLAAGRCTRCNSAEHENRSCSLAPPVNPNRAQAGLEKRVRFSGVQTQQSTTSSKPESDDDEGKE